MDQFYPVSLRISLKYFRYKVFSGALIVMPSSLLCYGELSAYIELIQLCNLCHELKPTVVMTDEITEPHCSWILTLFNFDTG